MDGLASPYRSLNRSYRSVNGGRFCFFSFKVIVNLQPPKASRLRMTKKNTQADDKDFLAVCLLYTL
jgi:hypothetical protein